MLQRGFQKDISAEVKKVTGKRGVDVVLELVAVATRPKSLESPAPAGRLVTCDAATGFDARIDLRFLSSKQRSLVGSFMGSLGDLDRMLKFVFRKQLKPVVGRIYPLSENRPLPRLGVRSVTVAALYVSANSWVLSGPRALHVALP